MTSPGLMSVVFAKETHTFLSETFARCECTQIKSRGEPRST